MENRMVSKLNVVKTPRIFGVPEVIKRCVAALIEPGPVSHTAAADWMATHPMAQYRFSNFDLYLMDQYRDSGGDAGSAD